MILDAGVLISIDRGEPAAGALIEALRTTHTPIRTTEAVVGQVWRSPSQARLGQFFKALTSIHPLADGRLIGRLLARADTDDVVDAHLVVVALRTGEPILTGDVDDLTDLVDSSGLPVTIHPWP